MKKNYLEPEVEIVNLKMSGFLCASDNIKEDGEVTPTTPDQGSDDWGSDY